MTQASIRRWRRRQRTAPDVSADRAAIDEAIPSATAEAKSFQSRSVLLGLLFVFLSSVAFGVTPSLVTALRGDVSILQLVTLRALMAATLLTIVSRMPRATTRSIHAQVRTAPSSRRRRRVAMAMLAGMCFLGPDVLIFYSSFAYLDTSVAVALGYIYPTTVLVIVAFMVRRLPTITEVALSAGALMGVTAVVDPVGATHVRLVGVLLVLVSSTLYATYTVVLTGLSRAMPALELGSYVMFGVLLTGLLVSILRHDSLIPDDLRGWEVVSANALLLVVAISCHYNGLRRLGASRAAVIDTMQPLVAVLAGSVILRETLSALQLAGVVLIVVSVAIGSMVSRPREDPAFVDPR